MGKPSLELDEKYVRILENDKRLSKRVYKLINSFGEINSTVLLKDTTNAISETVKQLIKEKYPDI